MTVMPVTSERRQLVFKLHRDPGGQYTSILELRIKPSIDIIRNFEVSEYANGNIVCAMEASVLRLAVQEC